MTHSIDYVPGDGPACGEDQIKYAAQGIGYGEREIPAFFLLARSSSPLWLPSGWALTSPSHWSGSCQWPQCPPCCQTQRPFLISYSSSDGHNWSCPPSGNLLFPWPLGNHSHPSPPNSLEVPSPSLFLVSPPPPELSSIYTYSLRWYTKSTALNAIYMLMTDLHIQLQLLSCIQLLSSTAYLYISTEGHSVGIINLSLKLNLMLPPESG